MISVNNEISGSVAASLQVGASAQLREYTTGICVMFVCTGPRLSIQQDIYVGFDVLAGAAALDKECVDGPTKLATTFTDWDYHERDKDRCQLKKDGSFLLGEDMQIRARPRRSSAMRLGFQDARREGRSRAARHELGRCMRRL